MMLLVCTVANERIAVVVHERELQDAKQKLIVSNLRRGGGITGKYGFGMYLRVHIGFC